MLRSHRLRAPRFLRAGLPFWCLALLATPPVTSLCLGGRALSSSTSVKLWIVVILLILLGSTASALRPLKSRAPQLLGALITLSLLVGAFFAFELVAHLALKWTRGNEVVRSDVSSIVSEDSELGYRLKPNQHLRVTWKLREQILVDCSYSTEGSGWRTVPGSVESGDALIFAGCSFTFGSGVGDDSTLPALVAELSGQNRVINLGVAGYGPQHLLRLLELGRLDRYLDATRPAILIYTLIDQHFARAVGSMQAQLWGRSFPCYVLNGSRELHHLGTFEEAQPTRTRWYDLVRSLDTVSLLGLDLPLDINHGLTLTAAILSAASEHYLSRVPEGRFVVLIYPGSQYGPEIHQAFNAQPQPPELLDLSTLFDPKAPGLHICEDSHPTREAYARVARALWDYLRDTTAPAG